MDNAGFVCGGQCARHLDDNLDSFIHLHRPAVKTLTQRFTFDEFTGYVIS